MAPPADGVRSPLDEIEFLTRSEHRHAVLDALAERPRTRADLRALTGASSSTLGRVLGDFESRCWVERVGPRYEATSLGAFVAEGLVALLERMETERTLREVWRWLPAEEIGFDVELFADAVVTVPELGSPRRTVGRFIELVEETETMRGFAPTTAISDMEALFRNVIDGMEAELMWPTDLTETVLTSHPERMAAAVECDNLTVLTNEDLPCACAIFDERVGLAGYDRETGIMRATVDTDAPEARRWAEDLYASYRRDARPLDPEAIVA
jgi:predicted transcriptional regulator